MIGAHLQTRCALLGIVALFHPFATMGAINVGMAVPLPTLGSITDIHSLASLDAPQLLGFAQIKPQPLAVGQRSITTSPVGDLLHAVMALGHFKLCGSAFVLHCYFLYVDEESRISITPHRVFSPI